MPTPFYVPATPRSCRRLTNMQVATSSNPMRSLPSCASGQTTFNVMQILYRLLGLALLLILGACAMQPHSDGDGSLTATDTRHPLDLTADPHDGWVRIRPRLALRTIN